MYRSVCAVILAASSLLAPAYGAVELGSVSHSVSVFSTTDGVGASHPSSVALYYLSPTAFDLDLGLDDPSIGRAHQTNLVTVDQIGAVGYADIFNGLGGVGANLEARSQFSVIFEVLVPQTFVLEGSLLIGPANNGQGSSSVSLSLTGPVSWTFNGTTSLNSTGTLTPGVYQLAVQAFAQGDDPVTSIQEADYTFCVMFQNAQMVVPEPSSIAVWLGIAGCVFGWRQLQRRQSRHGQSAVSSASLALSCNRSGVR